MVLHHLEPRSGLCDIGIGGGAFVKEMECMGFDVNPIALEWLEKKDALWNQEPIGAMTFWDSIEHMNDPAAVLRKCEKFAFISTPIYKSAEACIHSKHFKVPEHLWYFTERGLMCYMAEQGFSPIEKSNMEESAGRQGIGSYVFKRICTP